MIIKIIFWVIIFIFFTFIIARYINYTIIPNTIKYIGIRRARNIFIKKSITIPKDSPDYLVNEKVIKDLKDVMRFKDIFKINK